MVLTSSEKGTGYVAILYNGALHVVANSLPANLQLTVHAWAPPFVENTG